MLDAESLSPEHIRPLRRHEYERLVEMGLFADERVELIHGTLVAMSPQGTRHASAVMRLSKILFQALGQHADVRVQSALAVSDQSEPEPDIAVVPPSEDDYAHAHPTTAFLVVEVADSSLNKDRQVKVGLYATAGVDEYWIVNLSEDLIEVYTGPRDGNYQQMRRCGRDEGIRLVAFPDVVVLAGDVLPA